MRATSTPDRSGSDRADDPLQLRRHGIESPADPVVVEDLGRDAEDLFNRPVPSPVLHVDERGRRGEPVGDQRLDHLSMGRVRDVAHRDRPIDDACDVQAPGEGGNAPNAFSTLGGPSST